MSPYAEELANARLDALRTLIDALKQAETPDEKRRCAVAIFNAPAPCDLDDEIELKNEDDSDKSDDSDESGEIDERDDSDDPEDSDDLENNSNDDEDDIDDEDDHPDDPEETDTASGPARTFPPVSPTIAALSDHRCDDATPAPPDPNTPPA